MLSNERLVKSALVIIISTVMYVVEGEANGFTDIPLGPLEIVQS